MDLLGDYRTEIDKIDKEMTKLLEKRMNISKSISKYKMEVYIVTFAAGSLLYIL